MKGDIARRRGQQKELEIMTNYCLDRQFDFCLPCKVDMRDDGDKNLEQLRFDRIFRTKGVN